MRFTHIRAALTIASAIAALSLAGCATPRTTAAPASSRKTFTAMPDRVISTIRTRVVP